MQAVAVLAPGDAFEARLAVDVVGADAHAKDCLRLAADTNVTTALRCRAQFAVMMRQMQSALRTLQRMQEAPQEKHRRRICPRRRPAPPTHAPGSR